jgi:hypothetical protein
MAKPVDADQPRPDITTVEVNLTLQIPWREGAVSLGVLATPTRGCRCGHHNDHDPSMRFHRAALPLGVMAQFRYADFRSSPPCAADQNVEAAEAPMLRAQVMIEK